MFSKGRIAVKIAGRDQGVCVVLGEKEGKIQVIGPKVRKRFVSPLHLEPTAKTIDVAKKEDKAIIEELKKEEGAFRKAKPDFLSFTSLKAKLSR
jgi:ribosomal protein L14E/L6E/L27E